MVPKRWQRDFEETLDVLRTEEFGEDDWEDIAEYVQKVRDAREELDGTPVLAWADRWHIPVNNDAASAVAELETAILAALHQLATGTVAAHGNLACDGVDRGVCVADNSDLVRGPEEGCVDQVCIEAPCQRENEAVEATDTYEEEVFHDEKPMVANRFVRILVALLVVMGFVGRGVVFATDGIITAALAWQGVRPRPVPRRSFPKGTREVLRRRQNDRCVYCGCNVKRAISHIDHITPLNQGGPHVMANWQLLCQSCNTRKGDRNDQQFRYRYRALLSSQQGDIPVRTIRKREFDRITRQYADASSYRNFKAGKYYTPAQKVNVGGIVAGVVVGGGVYWGAYELFSPSDPGNLVTVCFLLAVATWGWVWLRAWYTGRHRETD